MEFSRYNDWDLPFLSDPKNEACAMMRKNIIHGEVDDDCQTDDDQRENAKNMLRDEIKNTVNRFIEDKRDGTVEHQIKNFNLKKRFSKEPFHLPCTE
jgi:tRNA(Ile)-lysidine synthase TilS/MesJ